MLLMARQNPTGDGAAVALSITSGQARILRPRLEMVRDGVRDDLASGKSLPREAMAREDEDAYARLLAALDGGSIIPMPHVCRALDELAEATDEGNEYERVAAEHDALAALRRQVCGVGEAA
jgi:hypothetical protein